MHSCENHLELICRICHIEAVADREALISLHGLLKRYIECVGREEGADFIDFMSREDQIELRKI
jgi:hypothetical protein